MNLYKVKFKDGGARHTQRVVAKDLISVAYALKDGLDTNSDTEWNREDIKLIKLIEKDVQIVVQITEDNQ